jgi:hypothetical protein
LSRWRSRLFAAIALSGVALSGYFLLARQTPGAAGVVQIAAPAASESKASGFVPPVAVDAEVSHPLVAEAEHAIRQGPDGERIAGFEDSTVRDARQRIVCGRVRQRGRGKGMPSKRYLSFGGTGIALIDDGGPDFAEMYLSACRSPQPARPAGNRSSG